MMDQGNDKSREAMEEEIWIAISAFQQILQAMPNDRSSLEALAHAFAKIGDHTQSRNYELQLAEVLVKEGDVVAAEVLLPRVVSYADGDDEAGAVVQHMQDMISRSGSLEAEKAPSDEPAPESPSVRHTFNMAEELSCAWNLMQAGELSETEYSSVVQDLSEMSGNEMAAVTVSVLHVLEAHAHKNLERILSFMSHDCGTPYMSLSSFDLQRDAVKLLPKDLMVRRGAVVFDFVGRHGLAVVMNPYDKELQKDIETVSGVECSFFITLPSEFDLAMDRIDTILAATRLEENAAT